MLYFRLFPLSRWLLEHPPMVNVIAALIVITVILGHFWEMFQPKASLFHESQQNVTSNPQEDVTSEGRCSPAANVAPAVPAADLDQQAEETREVMTAQLREKMEALIMEAVQQWPVERFHELERLKETLKNERAGSWSERLSWIAKEKVMQEEADNASLHMQELVGKLRRSDDIRCFLREYLKCQGPSVGFEDGLLENHAFGKAKELQELRLQFLQAEHESKLKDVTLHECNLKLQLMEVELRLLKGDLQEKGIDLSQMKRWSAMGKAPHNATQPDSEQASSQISVDANWVYDISAWDEIVLNSTPKSSPTPSEVISRPQPTPPLHEDQRAPLSSSGAAGPEEVLHKVAACPDTLDPVDRAPKADDCNFSIPEQEDTGTFQILVLGFNKHPIEFTGAVRESVLAQNLIQCGLDICPDWANGAKVLVQGLTPVSMEEAGFSPNDLRRSHVVVLPEHEKDVFDSLKSLSYRMRPREKTRNIIHCQTGSSLTNTSKDCSHDEPKADQSAFADQWPYMNKDEGDEIGQDLVVSKTFIDIRKDLRVELSPRSVYTKSSNDGHGIENPRKWKS